MLPNATIIYGDGTDRNLLDEEGLATCEAFAALTGMDEENILLALHAGRHSRAKLFTKVNRVNFEEVIASMPIGKVIRPKQTTAEADQPVHPRDAELDGLQRGDPASAGRRRSA